MMMEELDKTNGISVYVANLGKYNEGELVGGWITLPVPEAELERFLREKVGLELDPQVAFEKGQRGEVVYEEYAIHDYDFDKGLAAIEYRPSEYANLDDLNILAATLVDKNAYELEAVRLVAEQEGDLDPLEYANFALQADEIPYYDYSFEGIEYADTWSNEEKLGRTLLEGSPLTETLEDQGMLDYFDFEKYGEDRSYYYTLTDQGYLDCTADFPDMEFYDKDELKEIVEDKFEGFFDKDSDAANAPDRVNETVRDWYMEVFSSDELGKAINPSLTFEDMANLPSSGADVYDVIGVHDSVVRERIFDEISNRTGYTYDDVYAAWIDGKPLPDVNKTKEAVPSLTERCNGVKEVNQGLENHNTKNEQRHDMDAR